MAAKSEGVNNSISKKKKKNIRVRSREDYRATRFFLRSRVPIEGKKKVVEPARPSTRLYGRFIEVVRPDGSGPGVYVVEEGGRDNPKALAVD